MYVMFWCITCGYTTDALLLANRHQSTPHNMFIRLYPIYPVHPIYPDASYL